MQSMLLFCSTVHSWNHVFVIMKAAFTLVLAFFWCFFRTESVNAGILDVVVNQYASAVHDLSVLACKGVSSSEIRINTGSHCGGLCLVKPAINLIELFSWVKLWYDTRQAQSSRAMSWSWYSPGVPQSYWMIFLVFIYTLSFLLGSLMFKWKPLFWRRSVWVFIYEITTWAYI